MKRLTIILIILATALQAFSQIKMPMGNKSEVEKFYKTTTYVVMKNEFMSDYNEAIKVAVEKHWTATPVKFVKACEFEKLRHDDDKSFLVINIAYFDGDDAKFEFMILSLGGSKYKTVDDMPTLCAVPLCYARRYAEALPDTCGTMSRTSRTDKGNHPRLLHQQYQRSCRQNFILAKERCTRRFAQQFST